MTVVNYAVPSEGSKIGLYPGIDRAVYERIDAANFSTLKYFEKSPAHARAAMLHPLEPTDGMNFGTQFHCAILEPARFLRDYAVPPDVDRRTKVGKAAWAEWEAAHPTVEAIEADDFNSLQRMKDSVYAHPIARQLLSGMGVNEIGLVFENEETGILCKSLLDRFGQFDSWSWIVDVKSCVDASRREFGRVCRKLFYAAQAAMYVDGCKALDSRQRRFAWIAVEKTPPFAAAVYEADDSALAAGRSLYMRWLRNYAEAKATNSWPGYEAEIQQLSSEDVVWSLA